MDVPADAKSLDERPTFGNLLGIALDALNMRPPDYLRSILGPYRTWLPPHDPLSEFTMLDVWRLRRTLKFLMDIWVPSISGAPPRLLSTLLPPAIEDLFFVRTEILHRPDYYEDYTSYGDERWFFINGMLSNGDVAHLNAACLTYLFHRPITLIQNCTDGALLDLWECALGKEWYARSSYTESARVAFPAIYDALKDPHKERVVVICHSQGTIIMAVVLNALEALGEGQREAARAGLAPSFGGDVGLGSLPQPLYVFQEETDLDPGDFEALTEEEWAKLEIYCFATCCNIMRYHSCPPSLQPVPWIEHYGNQFDLVARLGMLAPHARRAGIHIDGAQYVRQGAWGHLLNIYYLLPIAERQKHGRKRGGMGGAAPFTLADPGMNDGAEAPRLYGYINGGSPERK